MHLHITESFFSLSFFSRQLMMVFTFPVLSVGMYPSVFKKACGAPSCLALSNPHWEHSLFIFCHISFLVMHMGLAARIFCQQFLGVRWEKGLGVWILSLSPFTSSSFQWSSPTLLPSLPIPQLCPAPLSPEFSQFCGPDIMPQQHHPWRVGNSKLHSILIKIQIRNCGVGLMQVAKSSPGDSSVWPGRELQLLTVSQTPPTPSLSPPPLCQLLCCLPSKSASTSRTVHLPPSVRNALCRVVAHFFQLSALQQEPHPTPCPLPCFHLLLSSHHI